LPSPGRQFVLGENNMSDLSDFVNMDVVANPLATTPRTQHGH